MSKIVENSGLTRNAMVYGCEDCGHYILVWLERGLCEGLCDDENVHKPVPFAVVCPKCKGVHMYHKHWDLDIHLKIDIDIPNHSYYFSNCKNYDCGKFSYKK